jgi:hypothetical protein
VTPVSGRSLEETALVVQDFGGGDLIISYCADGWIVSGYRFGKHVSACAPTIIAALEQMIEKMRNGLFDPERDVTKYLPTELQQDTAKKDRLLSSHATLLQELAQRYNEAEAAVTVETRFTYPSGELHIIYGIKDPKGSVNQLMLGPVDDDSAQNEIAKFREKNS